MPRSLRLFMFVILGSFMACSGSITCAGCGATGLPPVPGGFDDEARIDRAAQMRVTPRGLDGIEMSFLDLAGSFLELRCGGTNDVPCPTQFVSVPGGAPQPTQCDLAQRLCVDPMTNLPEPVLGLGISRMTDSGVVVCRDDPSEPNARPCFGWLRLESLELEPRGRGLLAATIATQIYTTQIPVRVEDADIDCVITMDSSASGSPIQELVLTARVNEWTPPNGVGGRQLEVSVLDVSTVVADADLTISGDPLLGDARDMRECAQANVGFIKDFLVFQVTDRLSQLIDDEVKKALAWSCTGPGSASCPADTSCVGGRCRVDADNRIVPQELGVETRFALGGLLGGGSAAATDIGFVVGGTSTTSFAGVDLGVLGGIEAAPPTASCVDAIPSPRTRPGWQAPEALPHAPMVDLDFDGTPETEYMVVAALSQQILDQASWSLHQSGLLCLSISSQDTELVNTGSLSVLMPSLRRLTHADRDPRAVFPAQVSLRPGSEPRLVIGEGDLSGLPGMPTLGDPLLTLRLDDLELYFSAQVEERNVHLMKVTADVAIPLGLYVDGAGAVQIVVGDLSQQITNVRVTESEILAETPTELESAVPSLVSLVLPQLTDLLALPFAIPTAAELGGFDLSILGVRGVEDASGTLAHIGVYADVVFDPSQAPNLTAAAQTRVSMGPVDLPPSSAMSVVGESPTIPQVKLQFETVAPTDQIVEHQLRVDGRPWSPFFVADALAFRDPAFLVQGEHVIEVRARIMGEPSSLDATPVVHHVTIDTEPPRLRASIRGNVVDYEAWDVVSGDRLQVELQVDGTTTALPSPEGLADLATADRIEITATDEVGNQNTITLRDFRSAPAKANPTEPPAGCRCGPTPQTTSIVWIIALVCLSPVIRKRYK